MAQIEVKGFVSKPEVKEGKNGKFSTFTLAYGIKNKKTGKWDNFFFNVTNFHSDTAPEDGSRVEVKGWFKPRYFEKNGVKQLSLDILADDVTDLSGPVSEAPVTEAPTAAKEPWEE